MSLGHFRHFMRIRRNFICIIRIYAFSYKDPRCGNMFTF
uniref:Uncharacterized protein n=1 Tax=Arundo donax TaxID=35708 RepID=A0A0A9CAR1_ARUDO